MYEHPYLAYKVTEYEHERLERAVDRRRFLAEHADQIVPRPAGRLRRLTQRMLRAITGARVHEASAPDAVAVTSGIAAITDRPVARAAERAGLTGAGAAAPRTDRTTPVSCEPASAR